MTELWDLYTEDREKSGETLVRGQEIPEGRYHLVADAWIVNSKGEYLISQRSASRPTFPLMWECVGGSVLAGEDSLAGALREAREELEQVDRGYLVSVRKSQYSTEALIRRKADFKRLYPKLAVEPVTLDELMVLVVKGEKA